MQVFIKGEERYIPVSTVTLQRGDPGVTYPFHCTSCGNTHTIIGGKVIKIYPILEPSEQVTVVTTCHSCRAKFVFQETTEEGTRPIKVVLFPKQERQSFFCYLGGGELKSLNKILEYDKVHAYSSRLHTSIKLPLTTKCSNESCTLIYQFNQFS